MDLGLAIKITSCQKINYTTKVVEQKLEIRIRKPISTPHPFESPKALVHHAQRVFAWHRPLLPW